MESTCRIFILIIALLFSNLMSGVSQDVEINRDNNKSSIELIKDIDRIIHSLEEKDSLKISAYVDYCIDSIMSRESDVMEKSELIGYMCHDDFLGHLSLPQKNRLIDEILKGRYYDPCVSGYGFYYKKEESTEVPLCAFLIKNESKTIRNSVRIAGEKLSKLACDGCTVSDHKIFYKNLLFYLHDNVTINAFFRNLVSASNSQQSIEMNDVVFGVMYLDWFKYRKENLFETLCYVLRNNKKAYVSIEFCVSDGDCIVGYESLDYHLINEIGNEIVNFPEWDYERDIINLKFKGKDYKTLSEGYKQRVIKWMEKHKSDYVIDEELLYGR